MKSFENINTKKYGRYVNYIFWFCMFVTVFGIVEEIIHNEFSSIWGKLILLLLFVFFFTKLGYFIMKRLFPNNIVSQLPYKYSGLVFDTDGDSFIFVLGAINFFVFRYPYRFIKKSYYSSVKNDCIALERSVGGTMYVQLYYFTEADQKEIVELLMGDTAIWLKNRPAST